MRVDVAVEAAEYERIFVEELSQEYPLVDAFEQRMGFAIERGAMLQAARVLACPLKVNRPNWQHGRILYAAARRRFEGFAGRAMVVDIGTAKGYSALCLVWALRDAGAMAQIVSCDVIDPMSRERRNTVAEVDGYKTLKEIQQPWPELDSVKFLKKTGQEFLLNWKGRVEFAFVDGKHTYLTTSTEGLLLVERQQKGDVVVFDDVQIEGVARTVKELSHQYAFEILAVRPERQYAIGVRK